MFKKLFTYTIKKINEIKADYLEILYFKVNEVRKNLPLVFWCLMYNNTFSYNHICKKVKIILIDVHK